ncbi:MAG: 2-hydroxyacid dehydrogenase [Chloroflexota bacterium]|nr:2-hydroxyacid dehydrogenase [Anaerolineae bacterium]
MRVSVLGDLFMTNDLLRTALERVFQGSGICFEYEFLTDGWPAEPVQQNEEVMEFVGSDDEVVTRVVEAEIILTHTAPITRKVIDAAKHLRVVGAARGGPVNINTQACTERGIPVLYAPGRNSGAVAEFTIGLILAVTRNIVRSHISLVQEKRWRGDLYVHESVGLELGSAVVGIVGFGAIGSKVAHLCRCFGSRTLVYDPYVSQREVKELGHEAVQLDELLENSDIVTLHTRLTPETKGMLGEREFALMKESAFLINTARGELVQHEHLYAALAKKRIAGAGLDIFEAEPLPANSPLYQLDNMVATSHLAGASIQAAEIGAMRMADEIFKFVSGTETPAYCANPQVLGHS